MPRVKRTKVAAHVMLPREEVRMLRTQAELYRKTNLRLAKLMHGIDGLKKLSDAEMEKMLDAR